MTKWKLAGTKSAGVAPMETPWKMSDARKGIREWSTVEDGEDFDPIDMRKGFLLYDADDPGNTASYKLPYCAVIDDELLIIPRGVRSLTGARGIDALDGDGIDDELRGKLRDTVTALYKRVAKALKDDAFVSPYEAESGDASKRTAGDGSAAHSPAVPVTGDGAPSTERGFAQVRDAKLAHAVAFKHTPAFAKLIGDRTVVGFPTIYGNVDDGGDLIVQGAYAKTLNERSDRLRWLWQHQWATPPIASIEEITSVDRSELPPVVLSRFPEATGGLKVKRKYLETQRGDEVLKGIESNAITEMSIGYDPIAMEFPEDLIVAGKRAWRILTEIRLWEFSDVLWGMNPATANASAKSLIEQASDPADLYDLLQSAGKWSGVLAAHLQAQAKAADRLAVARWEYERREMQLRLAQIAL